VRTNTPSTSPARLEAGSEGFPADPSQTPERRQFDSPLGRCCTHADGNFGRRLDDGQWSQLIALVGEDIHSDKIALLLRW
jgi:hypothetical protein